MYKIVNIDVLKIKLKMKKVEILKKTLSIAAICVVGKSSVYASVSEEYADVAIRD